MIERVLKQVLNNPETIQIYREKALKCGKENHLRQIISTNLKRDFEKVMNGEL